METPNEAAHVLVPVGKAPQRIDPRQQYDGQLFLADRPIDLEYVKRNLGDPAIYVNDQGLISERVPIPLQPNPFFVPTLPVVFK